MEIVPQSASVTIEIEQVDMPSVTGRWDLEGLPPRPKGMDEPLDRGAWLAFADLSSGAITDGAANAAPVRGRSSGTQVVSMIRDVTEFRRAEVGCLWVDELETPVGSWRAPRRPTGRRDGARTCTFPVPPAASAGHRVQRVTVRCRASPPCPAAGVTPDQIPEADRSHRWPPGRMAAAAGPCAAPGPTRHATAAALSMGELLARAARRDPSAWAEIIRRYNGVVWARVRSFRLQDADTVDAVQMTWLRLSENCGRVQHPDRLGGWLATTATRETLQILRHTKQTAPVDDLADTLTDPAAGPERTALDAETAHAVRTLVAELPPRQRALIHAMFNHGTRHYTQISRDTGIPIGSIGPTRARTLRQLRRMLDQRGLGHPL